MSPLWTNLAGLAIDGFLYGVYFVLYISSTFLLIQRATGAHASPFFRSTIFVTGLILFVAVTGVPFFDDNSQITTTIQNGFAALAILTSDGIIIYRLWIVWAHNKYVIILPILTTLGLAIALGVSVQTTTHVDDISQDKGLTPGLRMAPSICSRCFTNEDQQDKPLLVIGYAGYSLRYLTGAHSGFIAWKIWQVTKSASAVNGNNLRDFLAIIIESAALSTIWGFFYIIVHQIDSDQTAIHRSHPAARHRRNLKRVHPSADRNGQDYSTPTPAVGTVVLVFEFEAPSSTTDEPGRRVYPQSNSNLQNVKVEEATGYLRI
ncbi:hypothetical protein B0H19DRAFT_1078934 [Mycena capillaripes]|nr:hypothetical protein B0H19DRAFT_1078934 [Mycena capillaripes]